MKEIRKQKKEKEENKIKNEKGPRRRFPAQLRNSPRPTPGISETVSRFLPYLADRWTPTVRFFFLQPKRTPETEPEE
jgi:hypothetical protein